MEAAGSYDVWSVEVTGVSGAWSFHFLRIGSKQDKCGYDAFSDEFETAGGYDVWSVETGGMFGAWRFETVCGFIQGQRGGKSIKTAARHWDCTVIVKCAGKMIAWS